mmetsp:Transcript_16847/g.31510  ORF Transcript_16847/g.31510 Transcript_16847/m.31510 type:complete len:246 (+) Transcript_16847:242-979(+)
MKTCELSNSKDLAFCVCYVLFTRATLPIAIMKFDLTFLLHSNENHSNEKVSFACPLKCPMSKSYPSSWESDPVSQSDETDGGNDHNMLATSMGTTRSTSIPLPASHVPKTKSELQLCIDEEAAEQRDARMFYRLVNGLRERQQQKQTRDLNPFPCDHYLDQHISRIVQARLTPLEEGDRMRHQVSGTNEISTEPIAEIPQEDAWSISGYDQEEQTPSFPSEDPDEEEYQEKDAYPEEEGLFEMDI